MSCQRLLPDVLPAGDVVERRHHLSLAPAPRQVRTARAFVCEHAPPLTEDGQDVLVLLTSELVTNAVLHARTEIRLGIAVARDSVLVTVHDQAPEDAEQPPYDGREGGWGLGLVTALAASSSVTHFPGEGKCAWFVLPRRTAMDAEAGAARRPGQEELGTVSA